MKILFPFFCLFMLSYSINGQDNQFIIPEYFVAVLDTVWNTEQIPLRKRDSVMRIYGVDSKEFLKQRFDFDWDLNGQIKRTKAFIKKKKG